MADVLIYDAVRTPRGKARPDGGLAHLAPHELVAQQIAALTSRVGPAARAAQALVLGCVTQAGDQGGHLALLSRLHAGLPDATAAMTVNNYCASGLTAIGAGIGRIAAGQAVVVLAGGAEMMSRVPFLSDRATYYADTAIELRARFVPPVLAADRLAAAERITRAELDEAALASQQRAADSDADPALQASRIAAGRLHGEECPRPRMTADLLAAMPPAFAALQDDHAEAIGGERFAALHTLAHAPPMCDGAALALIGQPGLAPRPRARVVAFAECGGDPVASLTAGCDALDRALDRAGLGLADMDRIEFMEAFAVAMVRFQRRYAPDPARVNVSGGHLAKGHPMGATGAILLSTLLDALDACQGRYGVVVVTGAMGVGAALVVERIAR